MEAGGVGFEDVEVGLEEAMSCLPSHVLHEAMLETRIINFKNGHEKYDYHRHRPKLPTQPFPPLKSSPRRANKPRYSGGNWTSGGPGMQAFFLDSGNKPCGTGVFLPQRAGSNFHSTRKPACAPVLLPSRVIQALNLNVHELGLQISPRRDYKNNLSRNNGDKLNSLNNSKSVKEWDVSAKRCVNSQNENSSPEIFLPKEWTY